MNELLAIDCQKYVYILVIFLFYLLFPQQSSFSGFVPLKVLLMFGSTIFQFNCIHVVTSVHILETASQSYTLFRLGLELQWF